MSNDDNQKEVTEERLRELLNQIIYHWHYNQTAMRKTRNTLIKLIGQFARAEVRKHDREKARHASKR